MERDLLCRDAPRLAGFINYPCNEVVNELSHEKFVVSLATRSPVFHPLWMEHVWERFPRSLAKRDGTPDRGSYRSLFVVK